MCTKADLPYWKRISSKEYSVLAIGEDRIFAAWENPDKSYSCFENIADLGQEGCFAHYDNLEMFIKSICWHDWIKEGIIDEELAKLTENK